MMYCGWDMFATFTFTEVIPLSLKKKSLEKIIFQLNYYCILYKYSGEFLLPFRFAFIFWTIILSHELYIHNMLA